MLKVHFGSVPNEMYCADKYFDLNYFPEWLDDPLVKEIIKDVDKSEVISGYAIKSPILGVVSPEWLSGGTKALICMYKDENGFVFNGTDCGDNCAKWILEISKIKDLYITFHHIMDFGKDTKFECYIENYDITTYNYKEFLEQFTRYVVEVMP